jgi:hypothetical protein
LREKRTESPNRGRSCDKKDQRISQKREIKLLFFTQGSPTDVNGGGGGYIYGAGGYTGFPRPKFDVSGLDVEPAAVSVGHRRQYLALDNGTCLATLQLLKIRHAISGVIIGLGRKLVE